ncbi:adenylate kinase isoenzyme 1 [Halyomorpha halys]|uniref:adenylate kinase isoenzyme 1 n=1 Tax=Halyomorpha halys TaxID=286706 RepID=UPI0034D1F343
MELGKLISEEGGFLFVTQDSLLQTEVTKGTERGEIIQEILQDKGTVCPGIVLDLAIEKLLKNLQGLKGVVFQGIPRDKEQAWHLQNLIGIVTLVIYVELPENKLESLLAMEDDEPTTIKANIEHFQKLIAHLSKHKQIMKVNGEEITSSLVHDCIRRINDSYIL